MEEPERQQGLTRCGLVIGPDEILGLHHHHGEALGCGEVAEGEQDLAHSVSDLEDGGSEGFCPLDLRVQGKQEASSSTEKLLLWDPLYQGDRLTRLRKRPPSPLHGLCTIPPSQQVGVLPWKERQRLPSKCSIQMQLCSLIPGQGGGI